MLLQSLDKETSFTEKKKNRAVTEPIKLCYYYKILNSAPALKYPFFKE